MRIKFLFLVPLLILLAHPASAQVNAASCTATDVQTAINIATTGQTVNVPAGTCTWSAGVVNVTKAITLNGAGQGVTNIDVSPGNPNFTVTQSSAGVVRIKNFTFTATSTSQAFPQQINVNGTWPPVNAIVFQNDTFTTNTATMMGVSVGGGVIISHSIISGGWNDFFMQITDDTDTNSWTTADTMGARDTTGLKNIYVEDNTFAGMGNGAFDCDSNCRFVLRHNTFSESGGFNSHGFDSSQFGGMRHFEIYNNSFLYPRPSDLTLGNINWFIWIRGGTGVIYNNNFDSLSGSTWGDKSEIRLAIRGAEDDRPNGLSCGADAYPVMHQLGQNNNGVGASFNSGTGVFSGGEFTDPIYFWGNTGNQGADSGGYTIEVSAAFFWGNPCGFNWNTYFQWGRDAINTTVGSPSLGSGGGSVEGTGGTAKPGYTAYTYPHPLVTGGGGTPTAETPTFSPVAGTYGTAQTVTISSVTSGGTIYYTTDGSTPTHSSSSISNGGTISVAYSETVEAIESASGFTDSSVGSATYTISGTAVPPAFNPVAGSYLMAQTVTISSSTSGGTIYYTTDGTTPTHSSSSISNGGTISVAVTETVKAIESASGYTDSAVGSASYTIAIAPPPASPTHLVITVQ
jgi:Chitobiase/beta-hexosaminidase C-terminal domain